MLRALMIRKKLDSLHAALEELEENKNKRAVREAELETDIAEAATEEEQAAVEAAVTELENEAAADADRKTQIERSIAELEEQLDAIESQQTPPAAGEPGTPAAPDGTRSIIKEERSMNKRLRVLGETPEQRSALVARDDVKAFLIRARELMSCKRSVTGAELSIPDVMLDIIREVTGKYSKLIKHVNLQRVGGKSRTPIAGTIPEAVWTEMIGKLNELSISFSVIEIDGYKVGGFIPVYNSILEDSDINLAAYLVDAIAQAIGFALDKAIAYGKDIKMPMGIVTRLAQTSEPDDYPATARTWADLHTSNIIKINDSGLTGVELFSKIMAAFGAAKNDYAHGEPVWIMNEATKLKIKAMALNINAAGALVSGIGGDTMPVLGGAIETESFMADGDIIAGYGENYLLAERDGGTFGMSEHQFFTDDVTVFKGTARYDGAPAIPEAFVLMNIHNTDPTTTVTFASDTANP